MIKKLLLCLLLLVYAKWSTAQSFNVEDVKNTFGKDKPLKMSGGVSANSIFNAGNETAGRDPFTYFLNGNINFNIYSYINLPFSFSFTNSGSSYKLPSSPNRLSIHPSYKWITAHIGDVSMSFSPYTLNGHMFTGAGVDLKPEGWEFSAMYGRLLKAVEYDEARPSFLPNYKRSGFGLNAVRLKDNYRIGINFLSAKDHLNSLESNAADSLGITPMKNLAASVSILFKPLKFIEINAEYGLSLLSTDIRSPEEDKGSLLKQWFGGNMSTSHYNAIKAQISYVGETTKVGIGYEYIDPGYSTLGAYYFTNDLENITLNLFQSFWKNKINLNVSAGYEHDDLANSKVNRTTRLVGSSSISANISERVNLNVSYSNFQTHTNIRSNFELINQENQMDKLDTLNFVQLSQSANLNLNIITKKDESQLHNLSANLSYQDAANKQGGTYHPGSVSEMINAATSYSISLLASGISLNGALNFNNSKIASGNAITWGPTLGVSSKLLKKKVNIAGSFSYNSGHLDGTKQNEVFIARINSNYSPINRHNITFAYGFQWRSVINRPSSNNSLFTLGYSLSF